MVVQASPQVTAAQVLDAGRRAEADGRVEYAIQFYRHLADYYAGAPEAAAARDALSRLKRRSSNAPEAAIGSRSIDPPPLRAAGKRGVAGMARADHVTRGPIRIAPAGSRQSELPMDVPEPVRAYLVGRLIAHGFAALGGFLFLAGLLAAVAGALLPDDPAAAMPHWMPAIHPFAGSIAAATGVVMVFWGQIARAVFDIASSSRDLAAIERAKVEHANTAMQ
jgi:hypothetical protein